MHEISRNQEMIETRMKTYVGMIEKELKKKEEQNRQLETFIASLKEELEESRADLEVLTNYVVKKMPAPSKEEPKTIRISNTSTRPSENQNIQNQPKRVEVVQKKQEKSISPKNKVTVLQKSKNFSPVNR